MRRDLIMKRTARRDSNFTLAQNYENILNQALTEVEVYLREKKDDKTHLFLKLTFSEAQGMREMEIGEYSNAIRYLNDARLISKKLNLVLAFRILSLNMGQCCVEMNQLSKASIVFWWGFNKKREKGNGPIKECHELSAFSNSIYENNNNRIINNALLSLMRRYKNLFSNASLETHLLQYLFSLHETEKKQIGGKGTYRLQTDKPLRNAFAKLEDDVLSKLRDNYINLIESHKKQAEILNRNEYKKLEKDPRIKLYKSALNISFNAFGFSNEKKMKTKLLATFTRIQYRLCLAAIEHERFDKIVEFYSSLKKFTKKEYKKYADDTGLFYKISTIALVARATFWEKKSLNLSDTECCRELIKYGKEILHLKELIKKIKIDKGTVEYIGDNFNSIGVILINSGNIENMNEGCYYLDLAKKTYSQFSNNDSDFRDKIRKIDNILKNVKKALTRKEFDKFFFDEMKKVGKAHESKLFNKKLLLLMGILTRAEKASPFLEIANYYMGFVLMKISNCLDVLDRQDEAKGYFNKSRMWLINGVSSGHTETEKLCCDLIETVSRENESMLSQSTTTAL